MTEPIRVLHVDDEPGFADLVAQRLERADDDFSVETATSAEEGLDRLSGAFDCVVSDYDMPGTDGIEFLEAVRETHPDVPFVLFTGKGSEAVASDAISAGVTDYLQKEGGSEQYELLANRIRNAVERYRARRAVEDSERRLRRVYERNSERRLRRVYERITDGFFAVDAEWRYAYVNEEGARIVGRSREELLGRTVWEAFPELEGTPFADALRTAMASQETTTVEEYYPPHDAWYDVRVYPAQDGISIYFQDVTERKERERAFEQYRTLTMAANDVIVTIDDDSVVQSVNPAVEAVFGYEPSELVGEPLGTLMFEADRERHRAGIERYLETGERRLDWDYVELTGRHADGSPVPVAVSFSESAFEGERYFTGIVRDVTERRERERERELMGQVIEEMNDAAVIVRDGVVEYASPRIADIAGYDGDEIVGEPMTELVAPEDHELVQRRHEARNSDHGEHPPEQYEIRVQAADGERVPVEVSVSRIEYEGESASLAVFRDVTERRERERRLETVARRFEAIFDNPMTLIGILDPDGTVLEVNRTAMDLVDASADDVVGEPFPETPWWTHSAEVQERLRDWIDRAAAGEHVRFEADHPSPDGRMGTVDGLLHPIQDEDGTTTELLAIGRDITERKRRERRLQEQNAKIQTLHEVATDIEACESTDAVYQLIVEAAESVLEFDIALADERREDALVPVAVSSAIEADQFYDETPVDAEDNLAAAAYRSGEPSLVPDIREQDVAPADSVFRSALTVPIGEYGVFQTVAKTPGAFDEDDLELVELLVAHAHEQLVRLETERRLRERTAELSRQNDRLEEFASVVSHDLRNPLNVAQGGLESVSQECECDRLEDVAYGLDRMAELIEDLLTLARQGDRVREREPLDLQSVTERCWRSVATADATLVTETDATVKADPDRLRQLLENIFRNGVEHGGDGVTLTVGDLEGGFYVADDGPGIPEADREAVFESGYSTAEDGTGFGLGIVRRIVEAHGWSVTVTDSESGGARFEITGVDVAR